MAISTERTVRDVLVSVIQGVASDLGFSDPLGNIKDYPIEFHSEEKFPEYLRAKVGSNFIPRAWAVDVQGFDAPLAVGGIVTRTYTVTITGYYLKDQAGNSYKELIDHARVIRGAINAISPSWNQTITLINSASDLSFQERDNPLGRLIVGKFGYVAERRNANF